jgi:adenylate cyclase
MDEQAASTRVLGSAIVEWLADEALQDSEPAILYGELCQRLRGVGLPVLRGQVAFRVLHPLYDASTLNWNAERGVVVEHFRPEQSGQDQFLRSPIGHILAHRLPVLRRRLTGDTALLDFAVLEEFRALGGTDYVVFLVGFDRAGQNGVICSWLGDRAAGFADDEIMQLQRVTRELSIALKAKIERNVAQNIAHAYLGKRAGQAVLNGLIRRGDGEKITAALWYSDLRHSTELADRLSAEAFLHLLGRYFEMTASSVLDHGGEVVSLIGDGVLGLFRFEGAPNEACGRARRSPRSAPATQHAAIGSGRRSIRFRHIAPPGPGYLWQCRSARAVAIHAGWVGSQRGRSSAGSDEKAGLSTARHRSLRGRNPGPLASTRRAYLARA